MLKVGVFMGGMSIEREVSFNSGRTICDHLDTQLFEVVPIFQSVSGRLYILPWTFLYRGKIADFEGRLEQEAQEITWDNLSSNIDFVYIAVHGKYGEDGRLQAMLELLKIPYLGTKKFGSSLGMDKRLHNEFLSGEGISVPKGFCLSVLQVENFDDSFIDEQIKNFNLSFPLIVKPYNEGSSFGVFVVKKREHLKKAIHTSAFISGTKGQAVLVEEKIEGMEFTCIVITDYETDKLVALPPTEILISKGTDIFDYQQKYMPGAVTERTPARCKKSLIEKMQSTAIKTMKALEFSNMARIDGFLTKNEEIIIIDSNPLSGMGPATFLFRQAAEKNIGHTQLINHLIKTELKSYNMQHTTEKKSNTKKNRLKVGVFLGGPSNEREVSLESGRNIAYKMSPEKYDVIPIFVSKKTELFVINNRQLVYPSTREIEAHLSDDQKIGWSDLPGLIDFAFIGLHGSPGEDGMVQGALEMLKIPYNGSGVFASSLSMDKYKTSRYLEKKGFSVPQSFLLSRDLWKDDNIALDTFLNKVGFPCIVKPHDDGCSVFVSCPKNKDQMSQALQDIFMQKDQALIEEFVVGMELTVGVVGNDDVRALTPSETIAQGDLLSLEEKFLPGAGENQTPARLSSDDLNLVRQEMEKVYTAVGCRGYARIDCFFQNAKQSSTGKKRVITLEINTLPGMTPATCIFHQAAEEGMRPMELIDEIIKLGLQEHSQNEAVSVDQALKLQKSISEL